MKADKASFIFAVFVVDNWVYTIVGLIKREFAEQIFICCSGF